MAIVTEYYKTREDGVVLNRTYSDKGMMIEREGNRYDEAIDPAELNRQYIETDEPVEAEDDPDESELKDKAKAYDILMGNEVGE